MSEVAPDQIEARVTEYAIGASRTETEGTESKTQIIRDETRGWVARFLGGLTAAGLSAATFANTDSHDGAPRGIATVAAITALALLANSLPKKKH